MKHGREDYEGIQDPSGKIKKDEPVFLLRGQDACAPIAIEMWIASAKQYKVDPLTIKSAQEQADRMREYQKKHFKIPDVPVDTDTLLGSIF